MRIFFSYASKNESLALQLERDLQGCGIEVWWDRRRLLVGDNWQTEIREAIRTSDGVLYLGTPAARASRVIQGEVSIAQMYEKPIYPIFAVGEDWADVALLELISMHYIDIRGEHYTKGIAHLVGSIGQGVAPRRFLPQEEIPPAPVHNASGEKRTMREIIRKCVQALVAFSHKEQASTEDGSADPQGAHLPTDDPRNPYKGLRAFTREDARDFFGREAVVTRMIKEIRHLIAMEQYADKKRDPRFVTVVGPSGSGKSSVVMAGLLPRLQKGEDIAGSDGWILLPVVRPGESPLRVLAQALYERLARAVSREDVLRDLRDPSMCALDVYAGQIAGPGQRVILLVDQFEELFTQTTDHEEREQFVHQLITAATEPENRVLVLVTLRVDFSDYPMHYHLLHPVIEAHRIALPPMSMENLRAVIEDPARLPDVALCFEENLVGDLLFDLRGQEENLPLLQFTLAELFHRRRGNCLTRQAYEEIGGVQGALDQHAQRTYANLPTDEHRQRAQALFTRLVNPGGLGQDATRRRVAASEFADSRDTLMQETLEAFINARLITAGRIATSRRLGEGEGTPIYEISHEALISAWGRLTSWINAARDDMLMRQTLDNDIEQWEREPQGRFYTGHRLKEALAWAGRNLPAEKERRFLQASRRYQRRERIRQRSALVALVLLMITALGVPEFLFARNNGTEVVTNVQDSGPGSLRDAIQLAHADSTITLDPSLMGQTILLTSGDLEITRNLTINGPGSRKQRVSLSNGGKGRGGGKIKIRVKPGVRARFSQLVFRDSYEAGNAYTGAAFVENEGDLTLDHCDVRDNTSTYHNGGGIANLHGTLTINSSTISGNHAQGGDGGGIYSWDGNLTLTDSVVTGNSAVSNGGGIYEIAGKFDLEHTTISDNHTTGNGSTSTGGGISVQDSELTLFASTIQGNTTRGYGGGLTLLGTDAMIDQVKISCNHADRKGGGLAVEKDSESGVDSFVTLRLDSLGSSQISANTAQQQENILGRPQQGSTFMTVSDDTSESAGSPAPQFPPERSEYFLGTIDLDAYCNRKIFQGSASLQLDDAQYIQCIALQGTQITSQLPIDPQEACALQYHAVFEHGIARLANYYDPSSWQCYTHERDLGPITRYLPGYCSEQEHPLGINTPAANGTAYDWSCQGPQGQSVGIAITDACQWHYGRGAFDVLVDFRRPDGWECWGPES
ncbi:MAG TPA: TIR domain-containing protein [Ktedonobacteraceae bacterium]|jgi:hypothetical protein